MLYLVLARLDLVVILFQYLVHTFKPHCVSNLILGNVLIIDFALGDVFWMRRRALLRPVNRIRITLLALRKLHLKSPSLLVEVPTRLQTLHILCALLGLLINV